MIIKERVILNTMIGHPIHRLYKLVLKGQIADKAEPGQFVHIQVSNSSDPLLRRPLSIAEINKEEQEITIYYRVQGKGTELLSSVKEEDHLSIIGPLGRGFTVPKEGTLILVAGGIGIFPLFSLINSLKADGVEVQVLWGGEDKSFIESAGLGYLEDRKVQYQIATMDGTLGKKGLVTDLLSDALKDGFDKKGVQAAACGPSGMLEAVSQICELHNLPLEVSLEERMACGVGACLGCVCTTKDQEGNLTRKRVCKDGPVFKAEEVVWNAGI